MGSVKLPTLLVGRALVYWMLVERLLLSPRPAIGGGKRERRASVDQSGGWCLKKMDKRVHNVLDAQTEYDAIAALKAVSSLWVKEGF